MRGHLVELNHFDPVFATEQIANSYERYIKSSITTNNPSINDAIKRAIDAVARPLVKGPIIQTLPNYKAGSSIEQLVGKGTLSTTWLERDFGDQIVQGRPLYAHQDIAICKSVVEKRNVVVATGTGSGKTETFLIPIVEELFRQSRSGCLGPGVRALLLYPMNALANDQLKRLRLLLKNSPEITFGRYTGETPVSRREGLERLRESFPDVEDLPNELLGREEMQQGPPHILLTNYAMLEYLLLRPDDSPLFDVGGPHSWKFIVLDEVHTYDGAAGMEIGMLLRRLCHRVRRGPGTIQAIATSATIGGPDDRRQVAHFASELFDLPFEWDDSDPSRQDVIGASVETPRLPAPGPRVNLSDAVAQTGSVAVETVLADDRVQALLRTLWRQQCTLEEAAELVSDPPDTALAGDLIRWLSHQNDPSTGLPVLRARFHTFVRAPEGVQVCLRPHSDGQPRAFLESHRFCPDCGEGASLLELATCRRCTQWHLRGVVESGQFQQAPDLEDDAPQIRYLAPRADEEVNEDALGEEVSETTLFGPLSAQEEQVILCFSCHRLHSKGPQCACDPALSKAVVLASRTSGGAIRCVNCGAPATQGGPRRLRLGTDAPPAVVASALFDALPRKLERPRFLSFADSRQDAAFFAPYLERTYGRITRRRLLLEALELAWAETAGAGVSIESLAPLATTMAHRRGFFEPAQDQLARANMVKAWIVAELTALDSRQSLVGAGLATRRLARPKDWQAPPALLNPPWSLTSEEAWFLIEALLATLVDDQAIAIPDGVDITSSIFSPRNKEFGFRELKRVQNAAITVLGWSPAQGTNARLDFLSRIISVLHPDWQKNRIKDEAQHALDGIWKLITSNVFRSYLKENHDKRLGTYYQLLPEFWRFERPDAIYRCDTCGHIHASSVRGVCRSFRCPGRLSLVGHELSVNHYRELYLVKSLGPLVAEEHTAQWTSAEAARIQADFVSPDGKINVLSCSTTFELGVDVGELEAVLLRNVPPSASNYVQRAGRVGRRSSSIAFVVTFAQLRPHDIHAFDNAIDLVAGRVPAPRIPSRNLRITRRHVHSVALSRFLRARHGSGKGWPRTAQAFFAKESDTSYCEDFRTYLAAKDADLLSELKQVVPRELHPQLGLETWAWSEELASTDPLTSSLALVENEYFRDVITYERFREEAKQANDGRGLDRANRVLNTINSTELIGLLARRNVLPKYGFPVDVVPLRTVHLSVPEARTVELERDLRVAIAEYAPGAEVIAAKRRWASAGLYLLPNKGLPERDYAICQACNRLYLVHERDECTQCGDRLKKGKFVQPLFGFVAEDPSNRPLGEDRPRRLYATRVLFHDLVEPTPRTALLKNRDLTIVEGRFARQGNLAVVNTARGKHFRLCHTCGFAKVGGHAEQKHSPPDWPRRSCTGTLHTVDLGHVFTSDITELCFPTLDHHHPNFRPSLLAALLEGARRTLNAGHGDIDGLTYMDGILPVFALYDSVPGGAGLAREAFNRFRDVLESARRVCKECTCGEHSSCYGCLRSYSNQFEHDALDRTVAAEALDEILTAAT